MLVTARRNVAAAGLDNRIFLVQGDATRLDPASFGREKFERVFFSYSLSMIPPWRAALAHGAALLAPGGRLSLVDFWQQDGLPRWFRSLLFAWLARFHVSPPACLAEEVGKVAAEIVAEGRFERLYRGYACYAELDRPAGPPEALALSRSSDTALAWASKPS
jgi:S-adenosylmethionine-diacylgycerolhomoserine-N-methlytransferase